MAAGDFDQPIAFERETATPDGMGGEVSAWTQVGARAFASILPVRQTEAQRQGTQRASRTVLFKIWYRRDIDEAMRIVWDGQIFNIREIRRGSPRDLTMQITAEAGVTQ